MNAITVISSNKLGASELKIVASIAKDKLDATGKITNTLDKSLIAGVKIIGNGRELDLSIAGTLARMGKSLT